MNDTGIKSTEAVTALPEKDKPKRFGELLIELGAIDTATLTRALRLQEQEGGRIGEVLTKLGTLSDADRAKALSVQLSVPLIEESDLPDEPLPLGTISLKFLHEAKILPIEIDPDNLILAMADPSDSFAIHAMELSLGKSLDVAVATERDIETTLRQLYEEGSSELDDILTGVDGEFANKIREDDVERLRDMASEAPVIRLVNMLLARALERRASDIHIEPFEAKLKVRYRIDGVLREMPSPPPELAAAITSRVKIMSRLNIAERRLAQDGRFTYQHRGRDIDVRVSTVPTVFGESVVMRLLDKGSLVLDLPTLGYAADQEIRLREILTEPNGIIIVTGPTGSGKSTSLYSSLSILNTTDKKIITVEDPVEYQIEGINQIQVAQQIGLNFSTLLRSVVRQDPDIIMIGEMRDLETTRIAVQSALTGHLVLSTLHTNNAAGAITRLLDMGVEDYLMSSTLRAIVGQRLVRTLCPDCRVAVQAPVELVERLDLRAAAETDQPTIYNAVGCNKCDGVGYIGRLGLFEILRIDESARRLILRAADTNEIHAGAAAAGMRTMREDGLRKACAGLTTIDEVLRVTQEV